MCSPGVIHVAFDSLTLISINSESEGHLVTTEAEKLFALQSEGRDLQKIITSSRAFATRMHSYR